MTWLEDVAGSCSEKQFVPGNLLPQIKNRMASDEAIDCAVRQVRLVLLRCLVACRPLRADRNVLHG